MNNKKESFWNYLVILFGSAMKTVESLTTPEIGSNLAGVLKKLSQDFKEICLSYIQAQKENRTISKLKKRIELRKSKMKIQNLFIHHPYRIVMNAGKSLTKIT